MNNIKKEENTKAVLNLVKELQRVLKEDESLEYSTNEVLEILYITKEDFEDSKQLELTLRYLNEEFESSNFAELAENIGALKYRESFYNL